MRLGQDAEESILPIFDTEDLIVELTSIFTGIRIDHRINNQKPITFPHVLLT